MLKFVIVGVLLMLKFVIVGVLLMVSCTYTLQNIVNTQQDTHGNTIDEATESTETDPNVDPIVSIPSL